MKKYDDFVLKAFKGDIHSLDELQVAYDNLDGNGELLAKASYMSSRMNISIIRASKNLAKVIKGYDDYAVLHRG